MDKVRFAHSIHPTILFLFYRIARLGLIKFIPKFSKFLSNPKSSDFINKIIIEVRGNL